MAGLGEIFGGLMQGAGAALKEQGVSERESAQKLLEMQTQEQLRERGAGVEHGYQSQENDQQHGYRMEEGTASQDRQDARTGVEHGYRMDEIGATQAGENSRNAAALSSQRDTNMENTKEKIFDDVISANTQEKVIDGPLDATGQPTQKVVKVIDTKKAAQIFRDSGHADLAQRVEANGNGVAAAGSGSRKPPPQGDNGSIPVPSKLANEPDGTIVAKGGKQYTKSGNLLIPK